MARDVQDTLHEILARAAEQASKAADKRKRSRRALSGMRGVLAGAGAAALAPIAARGISRVASDGVSEFAEKLAGAVGQPGGVRSGVTDAVRGALPFGEGDVVVPGVGKGRRIAVQQAVDVGAPIETVYNQWTQVELWPRFMHRITGVSQRDPTTIAFSVKVWGKQKEFVARIETQRPDERIKWKAERGISHAGVVTFHELGPRLTRVLVGLDLEPGGLLEQAAIGLRHLKRAVRADLQRFKAFVEMQEVETGAWRGEIENGKVVQEHDPSYDKRRKYSKFQDIFRGPRAQKPTPAKASRRPPAKTGRSTGRSASTSRASSGSSSRSRGARNGSSTSSRGRSRSSGHANARKRSG